MPETTCGEEMAILTFCQIFTRFRDTLIFEHSREPLNFDTFSC